MENNIEPLKLNPKNSIPWKSFEQLEELFNKIKTQVPGAYAIDLGERINVHGNNLESLLLYHTIFWGFIVQTNKMFEAAGISENGISTSILPSQQELINQTITQFKSLSKYYDK